VAENHASIRDELISLFKTFSDEMKSHTEKIVESTLKRKLVENGTLPNLSASSPIDPTFHYSSSPIDLKNLPFMENPGNLPAITPPHGADDPPQKTYS
jgi:hypothetical protein